MKIKIFLSLLLLAFTQNAFTQNNRTENQPQAILFSGDSLSAALARPPALSITETSSDVVFSAAKAKTDFSLERKTFDLINKHRKTLALEPLMWSDEIAKIARLHSENMANFKFFSHAGLDGLMVNDRADAVGINKWQAISENIASNRGYENPVEYAVERWLLSPKHRANLLNSRWTESGIGIAVAADGTYYFTEVFLLIE